MSSQFGDLTNQYIFNPATQQLESIASYVQQTYDWSYSDRFIAYGALWAFNLLLLVATAVGLGKINFTRR